MNRQKSLLILGIESSCDETAAAVVKNGKEVLSNCIFSQIDLHKLYGGVVPEIASRKHLEKIDQVILEALDEAGVAFGDLDAIGVTCGPGLVGALLVGVAEAKAIAYARNLPLIGVHHIEGHILANFIEHEDLTPPFLCLVVSGGHTHLVKVTGQGPGSRMQQQPPSGSQSPPTTGVAEPKPGSEMQQQPPSGSQSPLTTGATGQDRGSGLQYEILGKTRDDAAGEAFDKVARAIGLGYPGGPAIDRAAKQGNEDAIPFPRAKVSDPYDFSFSGVKTAALNYINTCKMNHQPYSQADVAASFQKAVVDALVEKTVAAAAAYGLEKVAIAGGVACNSRLRSGLLQACQAKGLQLYYPSPVYCTDNAAMIGVAAYYEYNAGRRCGWDLNAVPNLKLGER